ncbi:hypothetical protein CONPUDRAFT_54247 [Coniophora puteana RWD-64-598 SS2]|uniref:Cleavage and polyadenylation specificity factor subunit 2 n=1 Tax=Coniophora puteana (strain RWD-64-598) TaxID=741705 RepID=A0A5M3MTD9_CONPW|nr:uncharacterized protein CONPUDRAFT_54247 [Coniophora puteana RWD-64-598 SS2]EIW82350.1 hypothetical protein CONPUDRAFT_54247 [Coniophora puteana RWD-64-598 SS2]
MITFTPLSGAARSSVTSPLAYLLQIDDVKILLDCGSPDWNPEKIPSTSTESDSSPYFWQDYCNALKQCAPSVDLVLLSHGDLSHCGLFAYAYSRWGLKAPVYSTLPVQAMGRIATTEDVDGLRDEGIHDPENEQDFDEEHKEENENEEGFSTEQKEHTSIKFIATMQEVHEAFDSINTLRYSQPTHLQGRCQGITVTPFNAGHTLGGTIWKIRSPSAGTILYAVNINHMRERHLDGTILVRSAGGGVFEQLARPDLLITDADRANVVTSRRKDRDAALMDCISATLSSRSSLLLPCDSSTRVLELLVLLDQHWKFHDYRYPICFLSRNGREMLTFVRSMMEWLGGTVNKEDVGVDGSGRMGGNKRRRDDDADDDALGAFALRFPHLEFFPNPDALLQTYSSKDPKIILAVPASLSHGPSRSLFVDFAAVPDNVVLLTGRGEEGTLGQILFGRWNDSQRADDKWDKGKIGRNVMMDGAMRLKMSSKVPLQGTELELYLAKERATKEKEVAQQAAMARNQRMLEADEDESDEESDSDAEEDEVARALGVTTLDSDDISSPNLGLRKRKGESAEDGEWADMDEGLTKQVLSFDIYLKGNMSKATSFFKTSSNQSQRFRMFPYVEKKRRVDEYGETIDVGMWLRKGKVMEEDSQGDEAKDVKRRQAEEEEKFQKAAQEPPYKFVTSEIEVQLACRLLFIDMQGLNDGRSVKTIIPQMNPRKMIIVHASESASEALISSCANIHAMTKDIYAPQVGDSVQIGQQTNSFSISLSDELIAGLKMSRFEDNEVAYVTGRVISHFSSTIPILGPAYAVPPARQSSVVSENVEPPKRRTLGSRSKIDLPHSTMIGELKLTSLKSRLAAVGIHAELIGEGVLICGAGAKRDQASQNLHDTVAVRKTTSGKVELEGNVSDVYYNVRNEIYKLHALVAA